MTKGNSSFKMYEELLADQYMDENLQDLISGSFKNEEDVEEFLTSKEIVKNKEELEKKSGVSADAVEEETFYFKRYTKRREHKYTDSEMNDIRESCLRTIVHDYGEHDWYHLSIEEQMRRDQLSEISVKLAGLRTSYRRVDQYIEAMRVVFEAWTMLSKENYIHKPNEFFKLVGDGKIVSSRIPMPKLKKIDQYNIDMIINYISNPELDPTHLVPAQQKKNILDSFFEDDNPDDEMIMDEETGEMRYMTSDEIETKKAHRFLSESETSYILEHIESPDKIEIASMKPKYIKGYDARTRFTGKKKKRKGGKRVNRIRDDLAVMLNTIQNSGHYRDQGRSYMVTHSLFTPEKKEKSFWDEIEFDASWADDDAVMLYDMVIREEFMKQKPLGEKYLTYGDKDLDAFYKSLEENGISTVDIRRRMGGKGNGASKKVELSVKKDNKKIESALVQRITELNKSDKFKKIIKKAEEALSDYRKEEYY